MNYNITAYCVYIPVTIGLSIWIAKSLHKNTKAFLLQKFDREDLASSTNNLIQTGFYLIALGFSFMRMHIEYFPHSIGGRMFMEKLLSPQETMEHLAYKLGAFTLVLGLLLFTNFIIMLKIQKPKTLQS